MTPEARMLIARIEAETQEARCMLPDLFPNIENLAGDYVGRTREHVSTASGYRTTRKALRRLDVAGLVEPWRNNAGRIFAWRLTDEGVSVALMWKKQRRASERIIEGATRS